MLIRLLFNNESNRCEGYLLYYKQIYPYDERKNILIVEKDLEKVTNLLGNDWRAKIESLILYNNKIKVDKNWESK